MRKTKKTLSLLLALAMVLTLFAGVAQANSYVTVTSLSVRIPAGADSIPGRINIVEGSRSVVTEGMVTEFSIKLPDGVTWDDVPTSTNVRVWFADNVAATSTMSGQDLLDYDHTAIFTLEVEGTDIEQIRFFNLPVFVDSDFRGDIEAEVTVTARGAGGVEWEQEATVVIANVPAPGTTSTVIDPTIITRGARNQAAGDIRITENAPGSLTPGAIQLELPSGITFADNPVVEFNLTGASDASIKAIVSSTNRRIATISVTSTQTNPGGILRLTVEDIKLNVGVGVSDGPINVRISNGTPSAGVDRAVLTIATIGAEAGRVTVSREGDLPDVWNLGGVDREIATIRIAETAAGSLLPDRVVTLTLPEGYTWHTAPGDDGAFDGAPEVSDDGRTLTYWTYGASATRTDFDLSDASINANAETATPGDVRVTVGGNAGASGTVVVATSRRAATAAVLTTPNVIFDSDDQVIGSIVITEVAKETFADGDLVITFPEGVTVVDAGSASVSVATGLAPDVGDPEVVDDADDNKITISVDPAFIATAPASITISGIEIDLNGVPLGAIKVSVGGDAITGDVVWQDIIGDNLDALVITNPTLDEEFTVADAIGGNFAKDIVVANVVSATARTTVFTVDSTAFTVDGVSQPALVVAPFIQAGRTFVPLRAAANAVGVTNENIMFDAATRTITLMKNDRLAQFTLGSRVVLVNGMPLTMEAAPVVVQGRSMISAGWVARIFGGTAQWNAAARTVTITVR